MTASEFRNAPRPWWTRDSRVQRPYHPTAPRHRARALPLHQIAACGPGQPRASLRLEAGQLTVDAGELAPVADGLEDLVGALQIGATLVEVAQVLAEQGVGEVDVGLGPGPRLLSPAELDRLFEEHEPGIVALAAPDPAHDDVESRELLGEVVLDRQLLGAADLVLGVKEPAPFEVELAQVEPDLHLDRRAALAVAQPREGLAVPRERLDVADPERLAESPRVEHPGRAFAVVKLREGIARLAEGLLGVLQLPARAGDFAE